MTVNGRHDPIAGLLAQRQQQEMAQQALMAALQQTLQSPVVIHYANMNVTILADDASSPSGKCLRTALPTGERWDVPLSPDALRHLHRMSAPPAVASASSE